MELIDEIVTVEDREAKEHAFNLAGKDGIFAGISSGAAACAAAKLIKKRKLRKKRILAILPDTMERYLSTDLFAGGEGGPA